MFYLVVDNAMSANRGCTAADNDHMLELDTWLDNVSPTLDSLISDPQTLKRSEFVNVPSPKPSTDLPTLESEEISRIFEQFTGDDGKLKRDESGNADKIRFFSGDDQIADRTKTNVSDLSTGMIGDTDIEGTVSIDDLLLDDDERVGSVNDCNPSNTPEGELAILLANFHDILNDPSQGRQTTDTDVTDEPADVPDVANSADCPDTDVPPEHGDSQAEVEALRLADEAKERCRADMLDLLVRQEELATRMNILRARSQLEHNTDAIGLDESEIVTHDLELDIAFRRWTAELLSLLQVGSVNTTPCYKIFDDIDHQNMTPSMIITFPQIAGVIDACSHLETSAVEDAKKFRDAAEAVRLRLMAMFPRLSLAESFLEAVNRTVSIAHNSSICDNF